MNSRKRPHKSFGDRDELLKMRERHAEVPGRRQGLVSPVRHWCKYCLPWVWELQHRED